MKVKNINGTTGRNCSCGGWIHHWRKFGNQTATVCRAKGCTNKDLVGAHVQKDVKSNNNWYIVPFCNKHNKSEAKVELVSGTKLISANISSTCGIKKKKK
jgi:hypothetical protein